jgi:hypothetical protein
MDDLAIKIGENLLIIQNDKIVGSASVACSIGGVCGIRITDGEIAEALQQTEAVRMLGLRYCFFRYDVHTGEYRGGEFSDATDHANVLNNTRAVTEFDLKWGMVPESFKNTEGYRSALNREEEEA